MATKEPLGYIDCPCCGMTEGMRIAPDKNGDPFGYCEANCGQQMRIGGDKRRVRDFLKRYPQFDRREKETESKVTAEPMPPVVPVVPAHLIPTPQPAKKPRSAFEDALSVLGVK